MLAIVASVGGLTWSYTLSSRLAKYETNLTLASERNEKLTQELNETNARLKVTSQTLGKSVGMTQERLEAKAQDLLQRQQASAARLEKQETANREEANTKIGAVSGEVAGVKTDVGGVKTDVAKTQADLVATQTKLESMKGDLGIQSGLVAHNHDELEILKHKGDRNYYEFTLNKGSNPMPVGIVSLELKKADRKKNKFTLNVLSDDKKIEKKDKGLNEPVQFYTGKDSVLYELVVNNINKNQVVGYVSAPKNK
jgi:multidrug efflux pump subunit AcrA (membrane-fusion protein)